MKFMKIKKRMKPLIAYAVVNKYKPRLRLLDIYEEKDVRINDKEESLIKVQIVPIEIIK